MQLTQEQSKAVDIVADRIDKKEKVTIFTGYAGTGKTTTLNVLLDFVKITGVQFVAFTGTAAKRLPGGQTIHSVIYDVIKRRGEVVGFKLKPRHELAHINLFIVDEYSMVNKELFDDLESLGIPILLVGDKFQLPPIGDPHRYVYAEPHAELTQIHRQAENSPLLKLATMVRMGETLPQGLLGNVYVGRKNELESSWLRPDVKIICGKNATKDKINFHIAGQDTPKPGDLIMFLKNDMPIITNGTTGIVTFARTTYGSSRLDVELETGVSLRQILVDWRVQKIKRHQFVDFAWASTCHKAQGATYDSAGLIVDESQLFREHADRWIYTALTRYTGNHNLALLR